MAAPGRRVAARPITELQLREDTGSHRRPDVLLPPTEPGAAAAAARRPAPRWSSAPWSLAWAGLFSWLSVQRYRGFSTGRFDLGNMVQAVWSTAHGPLPRHDRRLGHPVQPARRPRRSGAGALRAALDGVVEPRDAAGGPGRDRLAGSAARLLARAPLARRRPPRGGRGGALPDGAGPHARHAVRLPPGHARGAAPAVLHLGGRGGALGRPSPSAPPWRCCARSRWGCSSPPSRSGSGSATPTRRRAAVVLGAGALAWVVIAFAVILPAFALKGDQPAPQPLLVARRQPRRDPPQLRDAPLGGGRDRPDARAHRLRDRPARRPCCSSPLAAPLLAAGGAAAAGDQPLRQHRPRPDRRVPLRGAARPGARRRVAPRPGPAARPEPAGPPRPPAGRLGEDGGPAGGGHAPDGGVPRAAAPLGLAARGMGQLPRCTPSPSTLTPAPSRRPST